MIANSPEPEKVYYPEHEWENWLSDEELEREEYEYSYYNSETEMQDHPERFIFNEDGTWERI